MIRFLAHSAGVDFCFFWIYFVWDELEKNLGDWLGAAWREKCWDGQLFLLALQPLHLVQPTTISIPMMPVSFGTASLYVSSSLSCGWSPSGTVWIYCNDIVLFFSLLLNLQTFDTSWSCFLVLPLMNNIIHILVIDHSLLRFCTVFFLSTLPLALV